jgi:adenylosuccinate lyase
MTLDFPTIEPAIWRAEEKMTTRGIDAEFQLRDGQQLEGAKSQYGPSPFDAYQTSLTTRYCSPEMSRLYSQRSRHSQWRTLWLFLAECEKELGIETITAEALEQMKQRLEVSDADFEIAKVEEKRRRHDVMAHVYAFGAVAPAAAGIIHYGVSLNDTTLPFFDQSAD